MKLFMKSFFNLLTVVLVSILFMGLSVPNYSANAADSGPYTGQNSDLGFLVTWKSNGTDFIR